MIPSSMNLCNSRMLTEEVLTAFRGRGDEFGVYPISFKEYFIRMRLQPGQQNCLKRNAKFPILKNN